MINTYKIGPLQSMVLTWNLFTKNPHLFKKKKSLPFETIEKNELFIGILTVYFSELSHRKYGSEVSKSNFHCLYI